MLNYYHILGVPTSASQAEIKSAYKQLAKRHHPDISRDNGDKFKLISAAYSTLSDPVKRRRYNQRLEYAVHQYRQRQQTTDHATQQHQRTYTPPRSKRRKRRPKKTKADKERDRRMTIQLYLISFAVFVAIGVGGYFFDKWMKQITYEDNIEKATSQFEAGNVVMTLGYIQEARNANASHYKSYELEGDVYNILLNNYPKAKRLYYTAIKRTNDKSPIELKLSLLHMKHGEYALAINDLKKLSNSDTLADSARFYLGKIYIDNIKSYPEGMDYLSGIDLPEKHPHQTTLLRLKADAYYAQGKHHKAQETYSHLLSRSPADGRAYYYRGLSHLAMKDTLQSCNDFEKALSLGKDQAKDQIKKVCTE